MEYSLIYSAYKSNNLSTSDANFDLKLEICSVHLEQFQNVMNNLDLIVAIYLFYFCDLLS